MKINYPYIWLKQLSSPVVSGLQVGGADSLGDMAG